MHQLLRPDDGSRAEIALMALRAPKTLRVMLVEETPVQHRRHASLLMQLGAEVTLECNGAAAVASVITADPVFDCVILDLGWTRLDDVEAIHQLRRMGYCGTILALTDDSAVFSHKALLKSGSTRCICKPIITKELLNSVVQSTNAQS